MPENTSNGLYEQYTSYLSDLLDKHAPKMSHSFTKGAVKWLLRSWLQATAVRHQFEHALMIQGYFNIKLSQIALPDGPAGRSCGLHYTLFMKLFFLFMIIINVLLTTL